MQEPSVIHNTFVLERSYPKPPTTVFSAFADEGKKRRWYAEGDTYGPNGLTPPMIETGWNGLLDSLQTELAR